METIAPELCHVLRTARHVVALTGAGISAESGIPTFRDATNGLWRRYRPTELATVEAFQRDPRRVWAWYAERRRLAAAARPNAAHLALAEMERYVAEVTIVTQNVDDLHRRAGSSRILELHGNLFRAKCLEQGHPAERWKEEEEELPPRCTVCGSPLRPDVVWFGEMLPPQVYHEALRAIISCDLLLVIGTSGSVEPAASLPEAALRAGATVTVINPEPTPLLAAYSAWQPQLYDLRGKAGNVLPALLRATWGGQSQPQEDQERKE
jgi:NAD-dependent deacetylase